MKIGEIIENNRKLSGYNEKTTKEEEKFCIIFTINFDGIIELYPMRKNERIQMIEAGCNMNIPLNILSNTKNSILKGEELTMEKYSMFNTVLLNYFSNKNNGIYNIERVTEGVRLLEELECIELPHKWEKSIEEWSGEHVGNIIKNQVWKVAYELYSKYIDGDNINNNYEFKKYKISNADIESLREKEGQVHLSVSNEYLEKLTKDIDKLRNIDIEKSRIIVDAVFDEFIKNNCNTEMLAELTDEEYKSYIDAMYLIADVFGKTKDDKSYVMELTLLDSMNKRCNDNYKEADIAIVRKVIGFTYGLAICPYEKQLNSINMGLTENGNIVIKSGENKKQDVIERLDYCIAALETISTATCLGMPKNNLTDKNLLDVDDNADYRKIRKAINQKNLIEGGLEIENIKHRVDRLTLIAMLCSDFAATHMNYLNIKKNPKKIDCDDHSYYAEEYHKKAMKIRMLLLKFYRTYYPESDMVNTMERKVLTSFSNIASLFYMTGKYKECLAIRKVIFLYYKKNKNNRLALQQAEYIINCRDKIGEEYIFEIEYERDDIIKDVNKSINLEMNCSWGKLFEDCEQCISWTS